MIGAVAVAIDDSVWAGLARAATSPDEVPARRGAAQRPARRMAGQAAAATNARRTRSALAGGIFLLYAISGSISRRRARLSAGCTTLNVSVSTFVQQVFVEDTRSTETSVFLLIIGAIVWGAGHFAAFNVFRRHQAAPASCWPACCMLINVSLTIHGGVPPPVVFVLAALLLVMRLNLFEQMGEWRSRGMRELGDISGSFLRNGAVMVALAIGASIFLAANASSAPLSRAWNNVDDQLIDIGYAVNRWLGGVSGPARGPNVLFTPQQTIRDFWQSSTEQVFTATTSDGKGWRWRGAPTTRSTGHIGSSSIAQRRSCQHRRRPPDWLVRSAYRLGDRLGDRRRTITPADFGGDVFVSPAERNRRRSTRGARDQRRQRPFVAGKLSDGITQESPYTVTAAVRQTSGPGAPTANELAASGTDYPTGIQRYLDIRPGSVDDRSRPRTIASRTAQAIYDSLPSTTARSVSHRRSRPGLPLHGGGFSYQTDLRGLCDPAAEGRLLPDDQEGLLRVLRDDDGHAPA